MGQQNIEAKLEKALTPQLIDSIKKMESDRDRGDSYEPRKTLHGSIIYEIFRQAKKQAWMMVLQDQTVGGKAGRLEYLHKLNQLGDNLRQQGSYQEERNVQRQIKELEAKPIK